MVQAGSSTFLSRHTLPVTTTVNSLAAGSGTGNMQHLDGGKISRASTVGTARCTPLSGAACRTTLPPRKHLIIVNVAGGVQPVTQGTPRPTGKQPPRPPELPGLMHSISMTSYLATKGNVEELFLKWKEQYGSFYEFQIPGSPPVVIVSDPEAIREVYEVLQYHKSPRYADLLPVLGTQSMVTSEGHVWRAQRDAFNPGFSSSFLKAALPGFISCTEHLVERLDEAAEREDVVLMHLLAVLTTLEIICKVGFGEDIDFLSGGREGRLWSAFEGLGRHVAWFLDNVPLNWLKDLPWNKSKTVRLQEQLDSQLMDILLKRLNSMGITVAQQQQQQKSSTAPKCPIPGMSAAATTATTSSSSNSSSPSECPFQEAAAADGSSSSSSSSSSSGTGPTAAHAASAATTEQMMLDSKDILTLAVKLSQQDGSIDLEMLLSQMKTFFAAGHDTTASLIGWTMWYLCLNPDVEHKLAAEIQAVLGDDKVPSYQQLTEMKYLNAVLKESLRIRPPVGLLARWAPEGTTLGGYDTSNKVLLVSPYIQQMDTDVWGADAGDYRPERWLEEDGAAQKAGPYSYMPFSRGPRDCIGSRFALLEAKTILTMVLSKFAFEYAGDKPEEVMMSVTAHPKYGVPLRVKRRQGASVAAGTPSGVPVGAAV